MSGASFSQCGYTNLVAILNTDTVIYNWELGLQILCVIFVLLTVFDLISEQSRLTNLLAKIFFFFFVLSFFTNLT